MTDKRVISLVLVGTVLLSATVVVQAEPAMILGDSIGVGIAMAGGAPRLAHNSVTIRGGDAVRQISRLPADSVAVLSLGTNDAVGSIAGVEKGIDRIVDATERSGLRLVWVGPPCVRKNWNTKVQVLDGILRARLANKVAYVSIADPGICDPRLRAGDGVHFTMQGYRALWARASAALPANAEAETAAPALSARLAAVAAVPSRPVP